MPAKNKKVKSQVKVFKRVFFKDSNIILKYSILGDCFGLEKTYSQIGRPILNMKHKINTKMSKF